MTRLPMRHIRKLIEQAYLTALECRDAQLLLHLGLAMQVSFAKEVAEQISNLGRTDAEIEEGKVSESIGLDTPKS